MKLLEGLDKSRFSPALLILKSAYYDKKNQFLVPVDILDIRSISSIKNWLVLYRYLKKKNAEGYVLAHTYFYDSALMCPPILKLLGYKVLVSRRDMGYWYTRLNLLLLRFNRLFVDTVVANSNAVKTITMEKEGYQLDDVTVIYNGYMEPEKNAEHLGVSVLSQSSEIRIVLVANIRPIKRIADAIHALREVINTFSNVVLYVIGDGNQEELINLSKNLDLDESVHFLGARNNIPTILKDFDIGILCSESEGFSNTIIEYMQSGLPVICSKVGGNPEIVEHGINGFLYAVGDINTLSGYMNKLVNNKQLCSSMGKAGMKKVLENYSMKKYIGSHQALYETLVS